MSLIFSKTIKNEQKSLPERCSFRKGPAWTNAPKETPGCTCPSGSMTLEAAVVVPILACLFTFVLFFFRVMQVQLCVQDALEDTGRTLSVYAAVKDSQEEKYAVLAKSMFIAKAREDDNIRKFVTGISLGVSILMVLNLYIINVFLSIPTLFCLKKIAPLLSTFIAIQSIINSGDKKIIPNKLKKISINLFIGK